MEARGLKAKPWCERAGVSPNTIYNFMNGRSESLAQDSIEKLAAAEGVPASFLLGEGVIPLARSTQSITVMGHVQAGAWADTYEWPEEERYAINVPKFGHIYEKAHGLLVRGDGINELYPDGSIVCVVNIHEYDRVIKSKALVVCERSDLSGNIEASVKQLQIDEEGRAWLWPRSTNPQFQQPIAVTAAGLAGEHLSGDITVRVSAVVIGGFSNILPE